MSNVYIDENLCKKCDLCAEFCPKQVFGKHAKILNAEKCDECGNCQILCPERAIVFSDDIPTGISVRISNKPRGGNEKRKNRKQTETAFLNGNEACGQAALDAGCGFFAGYPITPATEIMYKMMELKKTGGFIQMEDEIASIHAVIGASISGMKSLTATSGPGLDLMQEGLSWAVATEIPCVLIVVQRGGPSTGQATRPAQADIMASIWGSHGDSPRIILTASSVQDCYCATIKAFNFSEIYRTPVIVLLDELLAHTKEKLVLPDKITVFNRVYRPGKNMFGNPLVGDHAASMPNPENGENFTYTGSTHLFDGNRSASSPEAQQKLNDHLSAKMKRINSLTLGVRSTNICKKNETIFISLGTPVRSILPIIKNNPWEKAGLIEIKRLWPFPKHQLETLKERLKNTCKIMVVEMNQGQLIHLVRPVFPEAKLLSQNNGLTIEPARIKKFLENGTW